MDKLETFFKNNKEGFNYIEPDADGWDQLNEALNHPIKPGKIRSFYWLKVAGVLLLLAGFFTYLYIDAESKVIQQYGLEPDMIFPDISLRNPDGLPVALDDFKGKIVLVEFWASWCMVCTEEHCYYFKPLYNTFKDQGFEIYSVSVDSSATNWVNAIERDELDWIQVSDLKGFDSPIPQQFDVSTLPTNYLLDKDGKIIAKNIDVEKLEDTLKNLLAYY